MKRRMLFISALLALISGFARADAIAIGLLSFDVFIPSSTAPPVTGINAFDLFNFTGPTFGGVLGLPYASDPLIFENASLTVTSVSGSPQVFSLGDIGPGELVDANGNPVVQFPAADDFASAIFTATLSSTTFQTSDGSTFDASGSIAATLLPSTGSFLQAGVDSVTIDAEPISEPSSFAILGAALAGMAYVFSRKLRRQQLSFGP